MIYYNHINESNSVINYMISENYIILMTDKHKIKYSNSIYNYLNAIEINKNVRVFYILDKDDNVIDIIEF